ncbi:MAG: hypothetical protein JSS63_02390 [Bacteroidetes bacterium]|nr:hypothetical protein [Bacteroidota bacterium]
MPSREIFSIGQVVDGVYKPDTTLTNLRLLNVQTNEYYPAVHIGEGCYEVKNLPNGSYKFYNGDSLMPKILGDGSGGYRHYFDGNVRGEEITSGTIHKDRLPNDIPQSKVSGLATDLSNINSSISTGLAAKAGLSANNIFTGINTFQQVTTIVAPIATDYADPDLDSTPNNLITNARLEYKIAHIQGYAESPNFLRVAPGIGAQAGKVYPDIQSAVTAFSSPSVNNICKCFIQGMGNNTNFIAPAYQCMKSFVNLIAADRGIVISFPNVNSSEKVTIENATVLLGAGEYSGGSGSARIWTNVKFINCTIYHFKNFTVRGGLLERCNIISPDGINFTADKDGSNIFTDIIGCTFRVPPAITDEAHYNGATDYTVIPALSIISDYTLNVPIEQ